MMRVKSKKIQRFFAICLILSFVFPYVPGTVVTAATGKNEEWEYEITDEGVKLTTYLGNATEIAIPSEIEEKPVTELGNYLFKNNETITKILFSDSITQIGNSCFYNCTRLKGSLILPKALNKLGEHAFYNCTNLSGNLIIPDGVTVIPNNAFEKTGLDGTLTIPDSVIKIQDYAFAQSSFHGELVLPKKVDYIGDYAFYNTKFSGTLTFPNSVTYLGKSVFYYCDGITRVNISNQLAYIQAGAFDNLGIQEAYIPKSVTRISEDAFGKFRKNVVIYGHTGSYAETYAGENGYEFVDVEAPIPTATPTATPTQKPTATPTVTPTQTPTATPTQTPTATPTQKPTATPTQKPTATPTQKPTATPTQKPTATPTQKPTVTPTQKPTATPTVTPTQKPTATPTQKPTATPTVTPTQTPTATPTATPTLKPTEPSASPLKTEDKKQIRAWYLKGSEAVIKWEPVPQALQYVVFRSSKKDSGYKKTAVLKGQITNYLDSGVKRNKNYYYKVKALYLKNGVKEWSSYSNVIKTKRTSLRRPKIKMKKGNGILKITFEKYEGRYIDLYVGKKGRKKKAVKLKSRKMKKTLRLQYAIKSKNVYLYIRTYLLQGKKKRYSKFTKKKIK